MKLTNIMYDLEEGTASIGLFGDVGGGDGMRPPHVQITVSAPHDGTRADLRTVSIETAIVALEAARKALDEARQ